MPKETKHFRVEYTNGAIYHIVASTNVNKMENWDNYFSEEFTESNGLASLFMSSDSAKKLSEKEKNIFDSRGNANSAAQKLIQKLNDLNNEKIPLFVMEY